MAILVCAATKTEAKACAKGIADANCTGSFEVLTTGVGLERARQALSERLRRSWRPELIISSGFAGALSTDLQIKSWVSANQVLRLEKNGTLGIDTPTEMRTFAPAGVTACMVVSSERVLSKVPAGVRQPAVADMESAALARLAGEASVPFMVLRLITDNPDAALPRFTHSLARAMGATKLSRRGRWSAIALVEAAADPFGAGRFVAQSLDWTHALRAGWRFYAPEVIRKNS